MDQEDLQLSGLTHFQSSVSRYYNLRVSDALLAQQLENAISLSPTAGKLYATVDIDKARMGRTRMLNPVHSRSGTNPSTSTARTTQATSSSP
jgi:hypothetical protein